MTERQTFVTLVLDETGSMQSIKDDTIGGYNQYVGELRQKGDALFTLVKFDSNHTTVVHRAVPIALVPALTPETYQPGAMTPLIDACYKAIEATAKRVAETLESSNVAVVIQTDGYENASVEHTNEDLARLIKQKTAEGWLFLFLGANMDAFGQARQFGISDGHTIRYTHSGAGFRAAGGQTVSYMTTNCAATSTFTDDQRKKADPVPGNVVATEPLTPPTASATVAKEPIVDDITI